MRKSTLIILIMALISCKSVSLPPTQKTLASMVAQKLGDDVVIQNNKDATFALCTKQQSSTLSVSYIIIRLSDLTVVEEDTIPGATLLWSDTYQVEIREIPGMIKKDDQPIKINFIDVTKHISKL